MKFISFVRCGQPGFGLLRDQGIVDLTGKIETHIKTLQGALTFDRLSDAVNFADKHADFTLSDITLLPVIPNPGKILCVGLNYETHRAETKRPDAKYPTMFPRYADSQVAHGHPLIKPRVTERFDYEGELAVIIGQGGRYIDEADAMDHVAGYACYNDATARDWQRHTHQFMPGKTFPGTGAFGPSMVDAKSIPDYRKLTIQTRLNGEIMQDSNTNQMIFGVEDILRHLSSIMTLEPGDIIATGTPAGVGFGMAPQNFIQRGDTVTVEVEGLGILENQFN